MTGATGGGCGEEGKEERVLGGRAKHLYILMWGICRGGQGRKGEEGVLVLASGPGADLGAVISVWFVFNQYGRREGGRDQRNVASRRDHDPSKAEGSTDMAALETGVGC